MGLKFEPKKFKFGMRTLKTGIAVFLVLGLFSALGWEGLQIGSTQMELNGGERIFSRKNTKTLIRMAKRADKSKADRD